MSGALLPLGLLDDPLFDRHRAKGHHPERPERLVAARAGVARSRTSTVPLVGRDATDDELVRVHEASYLEDLQRLAGREAQLDADTYVGPDSIAAARRAAGGGCALVEAMLEDRVQRGIALLRPPGHHALSDQAMGFCLLNNVAVAAAHARAAGLERVAIIDFDVHHGNGTQEIFWEDPNVLYISLHQAPLYPGTGDVREVGESEGVGATVNIPFSTGAGDAEYSAAFARIVVPVLDSYRPALVLVSAGYDAHRNDPLAGMRLDAGSYARMVEALVGVATRHAGGKIALFLEGGYDLSALEAGIAASLRALAGEAFALPEPSPVGAVFDRELMRASKALGAHWPVLR